MYNNTKEQNLRHRIQPQRTTKTSQKLVLFPEDHLEPDDQGLEYVDFMDRSLSELRERNEFSRVTAHYITEEIKLDKVVEYLRTYNVASTVHDECIYFYYDPIMKERVFGFASGSHPQIRLSQNFDRNLAVDSSVDQLTSHMDRSEVFLFEYGVIVFWNFLEEEELVLIDKLAPFARKTSEYEIDPEKLHFQYELSSSKKPRIFNDMITLKSANPSIKLTISHGLAQSVKLSLFENIMEETIQGTTPLSKMMATQGTVKMTRDQIMKIVGRLYKLKMNVNLISNVLDTPDMFWSEPYLEGLYKAIRGYLEIQQRVDLLNTRADVLSDLLDMLTDHLNSNEMTYITWIIIILVFLTGVVGLSEVGVKILRLQAGLS